MSMKLTALAMDVRVGNPLRKLVLLKLCDNANDQGVCWPSIDGIAAHCEISRRSVQNHIAALADDGFLKVIHRAVSGKRISNRYLINLNGSLNKNKNTVADSEQEIDLADCDEQSAISSAGDAPLGVQEIPFRGAGDARVGVQEIPVGVQEIPFRGAGDAHKPVIKPINNTTSHKNLSVYAYPEWFESLWKNYPPRLGANDKRKAFHAVSARIKNGKSVDSLVGALARYRLFLQASGKWGSEFVMQAATFFGPGGHIDNPWNFNQPSGGGGGPPRQAFGPRSTRDRTLQDDLTDRSWAK